MTRIFWSLLFVNVITFPALSFDLGGRTINIAHSTSYPTISSLAERSDTARFDIDLVIAICRKINCKPNWIKTDWNGIFRALSDSQFDMVVAGVSITEELDKIVDFSDPYIIVQQGILMRVEDQDVTIDDFKSGKLKLSSQVGGSNYALGETLVGKNNIINFDDFKNAVLALRSGDVDGLIVDSISTAVYEKEFAGELTVAITGLSSNPLGLVFQEGNKLRDAFNYGLSILISDGTLKKLIIKSWPKY